MIVLAVLAALPVIYIAAYLALLETSSRLPVSDRDSTTFVRIHSYRAGGDAAEWLFAPLNAIDRRLRPRFWIDEVKRGRIG
jgi:hypothetical protein